MSARGVQGAPSVGPADPSRRKFLKLAATAAGAAGIEAVLPATPAAASSTMEELAAEHADDPAVLIDVTKCTGCGSCVTACKLSNDLDWRKDQPALGLNAALASSNWSVVRTVDVADGKGGGSTRYVKFQCMNCLEPACASACFVKALRKSPEGPVIYDPNMCVGCRYCLVACPFSVPTFQWDRAFARISKCNECRARTAWGRPTACAEACPSGAITFGRRGPLLVEAWKRIRSKPDFYQHHVYGEHEVGGTSMLYLSDVSFSALGFPEGLPTEPLPSYTWEISRLLPPIAVGLGVAVIALYRKRREVLEEEGDEPFAPAGSAKEGSS